MLRRSAIRSVNSIIIAVSGAKLRGHFGLIAAEAIATPPLRHLGMRPPRIMVIGVAAVSAAMSWLIIAAWAARLRARSGAIVPGTATGRAAKLLIPDIATLIRATY